MDNSEFREITFGIVEDELIESEAMTYYIERSFPEAKVIWRKDDGANALEAIRQEAPDVLIVDIEMPVMNGLELCERLYKKQYNGVILINTAYDKFSYAKRAINLKAFDYIVKPVDNEELFYTLQSCIDESKRRKSEVNQKHAMSEFLRDISRYAVSLLAKDQQDDKEVSYIFKAIGWPSEGEIQAYVLHFLSKTQYPVEQISKFNEIHKALAGTEYFISADYAEEKHMIVVAQPCKKIGMSRWYTLVWCLALLILQASKNMTAQISNACKNMQMVMEECNLAPSMNEMLPDNITDRISIPARTWSVIRKKDALKYKRKFERYFRDGLFHMAKKTHFDCMQIYCSSSSEVFWELVKLVLDAASCVWPDVSLAVLIHPLYQDDVDHSQWFEDFFRFCEELPQPKSGGTIDVVVKLMETSFSQDITQTMAAEKLGLEPAYFSKLFKKRTGRNFSDMLTDFRMQHVEKMLLENPDCSLEELCKSCGLSSKTYLCEVFKK